MYVYMYHCVWTYTFLRRDMDLSNREEVKKIIKSSIGTKFIKKWCDFIHACLVSYHNPILGGGSRSDLACDMALDAVHTVSMEVGDRREIDIKRYAKVEKVCLQTHTHTHTNTP